MCIGNTTSPAASNTNYFNWRDDQWERPEVITPTEGQNKDNLKAGGRKQAGEKGKGKSNQSSKTTGGAY